MTDEEYKLLARAMQGAQPQIGGSDPEWNQWVLCVVRVGRALKHDNPEFDWSKWLAACEGISYVQ